MAVIAPCTKHDPAAELRVAAQAVSVAVAGAAISTIYLAGKLVSLHRRQSLQLLSNCVCCHFRVSR